MMVQETSRREVMNLRWKNALSRCLNKVQVEIALRDLEVQLFLTRVRKKSVRLIDIKTSSTE
jgi:hypothetical protein